MMTEPAIIMFMMHLMASAPALISTRRSELCPSAMLWESSAICSIQFRTMKVHFGIVNYF